MSEPAGASNYVGVAMGGDAGVSGATPMQIERTSLRKAMTQAGAGEEPHVLLQLTPDMKQKLLDHLIGRLTAGRVQRNRRLVRYARIDRLISTWQMLSPDDSERERIEDNTGKATALPMNLPILASHLADMTSYFAEALAPISNPFFSASGEGQVPALLKAFNEDALRRNYYSELSLVIRSLIKYNAGGFHVEWEGQEGSTAYASQPGNRWTACNLYNTMWDPAITDFNRVAYCGEWAAVVCIENRLELMRKTIAGEWVGLDELLSSNTPSAGQRMAFYKEPAVEATLGDQGQDSRTSSGTQNPVNWALYGVGLATDLGPEVDGYEKVDMYCWVIPEQHGLLTDAEKLEIENLGRDPKTYLELWRFKIINGIHLVDAKPVVGRDGALAGEVVEIPIYLSHLTQDQIKEAQRSFMELMRGFQRFGSNMFNIYIAGMRKNVWGVTGVDPSMFDSAGLDKGEVVGVLKSKVPGRDVRSGMMALNTTAGVDKALEAVDSSLAIKDKFFPSQALPSQIAGIDRAVKSQVATVVQGGQRSLRTLLRVIDSNLMLPTRMCAFRNLKRNAPSGIDQITDEQVAKMLGSGIESMEAERVSTAMWQLLYAIIQNQEAMQTFNVPDMMNYMSRLDNLGVQLGNFVRAPQQPAAQVNPGEAQPGAAPAEAAASAAPTY